MNRDVATDTQLSPSTYATKQLIINAETFALDGLDPIPKSQSSTGNTLHGFTVTQPIYQQSGPTVTYGSMCATRFLELLRYPTADASYNSRSKRLFAHSNGCTTSVATTSTTESTTFTTTGFTPEVQLQQNFNVGVSKPSDYRLVNLERMEPSATCVNPNLPTAQFSQQFDFQPQQPRGLIRPIGFNQQVDYAQNVPQTRFDYNNQPLNYNQIDFTNQGQVQNGTPQPAMVPCNYNQQPVQIDYSNQAHNMSTLQNDGYMESLEVNYNHPQTPQIDYITSQQMQQMQYGYIPQALQNIQYNQSQDRQIGSNSPQLFGNNQLQNIPINNYTSQSQMFKESNSLPTTYNQSEIQQNNYTNQLYVPPLVPINCSESTTQQSIPITEPLSLMIPMNDYNQRPQMQQQNNATTQSLVAISQQQNQPMNNSSKQTQPPPLIPISVYDQQFQNNTVTKSTAGQPQQKKTFEKTGKQQFSKKNNKKENQGGRYNNKPQETKKNSRYHKTQFRPTAP